MEIYPLIQARLFLVSMCFGAAVGIVSDIFRILREPVKRPLAVFTLRFICDFFTVSASVVGITLIGYKFNKGILRLFPILGFFLGFFLYKRSLSLAVCPIVRWSIKTVEGVFRIFLYPLVKILKILSFFLEKIKYYIRKTLEKIFLLVYNIYVRKKIKRNALRRGFLNGVVGERKGNIKWGKENISRTKDLPLGRS